MKRTANIIIIILLIVGLFSLLTLAAYSVGAQTLDGTVTSAEPPGVQSSGGQFILRKTVVAGGGATMQQPGLKTINATGGQTSAGRHLTGGAFSINSGFWTPNDLAPSAAGVTISGRVSLSSGAGLRNATVILTDPDGGQRTAITGAFGYYEIDDVESGRTCVLTIVSKRFQFSPRILNVLESLSDVNIVAVQ